MPSSTCNCSGTTLLFRVTPAVASLGRWRMMRSRGNVAYPTDVIDMRILLVHNRYQMRGGEDIVFETERGILEDAGHDVFVYERHNDEIKDYSACAEWTSVRRTFWAADSAKAIRKIIGEHRPDIAHFYNTFPLISPAGVYACAAEGVAVVQTLPNYRLSCPGAPFLRDGQVCELCLEKPSPGTVFVTNATDSRGLSPRLSRGCSFFTVWRAPGKEKSTHT